MVEPYCDKDATQTMAALVKKFQHLDERIDATVEAHKTSIEEQIDAVQEIAVLQEEREKSVAYFLSRAPFARINS